MTIAVTGATGDLGRLIIARLKGKAEGEAIVALARNPSRADDLGIEVRQADYDDRSSLDAALKGVDTLLFISASEIGKRVPQHRNIIEAAQAQGVGRIVYTSLLHADQSPLSLADEHRLTEAMLAASGIKATILRNGWYTENYASSVQAAVAQGALIGSAGEGRISSATRADYADAAVAVLTSDGHDGRTYELSGDEAYTLSDLAAEVSHQTSREIPYRDLPRDDYAQILKSSGLDASFADVLAQFDIDASKDALYDEGDTLSRLIGRPTTPLRNAVVAMLK